MANEPARPTSDQSIESDPLWERAVTWTVKILFRVYLAPFLLLFFVVNYAAILIWRTLLLLEAGMLTAFDATAQVVDGIARGMAATAGQSPWDRGFPHSNVSTLLHRHRGWRLLHNRTSDK